jgi:large subunit ribosomal protein L4
MAEIEIKNLQNEVVGRLELADEVFKAELNEPLIWEAVKHYNDSIRAGTAATKTRAMVSGSGKKLWRQKGTGRARIGSVRSPVWRHGGIVHGPHPREYGYRFPRKKLRGALRSALSAKLGEAGIAVVDSFELPSPKSKDFRKALDGLCGKGRVLIVDSSRNRNLELSSRNLRDVRLVPGTGITIHDVLNHRMLLFSKDAILQVQGVLIR